MRATFAEVERRHGGVGALVNNAGYSQSGAVEEITAEQMLRQRVFQEQGEERAAEEYAEFGSCESRRIPGHLARIAERMGTELKTLAALPQLSRYEVRYGLGIDPPG